MCQYYGKWMYVWFEFIVELCNVFVDGLFVYDLVVQVMVQCWMMMFCEYVGDDLVIYVKICEVYVCELDLCSGSVVDDVLFIYVCEVVMSVMVCFY